MDDSNRAPVDSTPAAALRAGISTQLLIVLGAIALTALLYSATLVEIFETWGDSNRRHWLVLVLAITVWLVWRDRFELGSLQLSPFLPGVLLVLAGSTAWLALYYAALVALSALALPALALAAILAAGGRPVARRAAFPLAFLYLGLPVWDPLNTVLQAMTAQVNHWLTRLAGIPVVLEENVIHIPAGWFEVAGGCSGLNYFLVGLAIAALDGKLNGAPPRSRVALLVLAGSLALLTNWLRVFMVILAGHLTDMQHYLVRVDHYKFGWVLFAFALIGYVYLAGRLSRANNEATALPSSARPAAPSTRARARAPIVLPLVAMALALGPTWLWARSVQHEVREPVAAPALAGWSGPELLISDWQPVFANADEEFKVAYRKEPAADVAVYRAAYRAQRQGKELRGYDNTIVGSNYAVESSGVVTLNMQGKGVRITEQQVQAGDGRRLLIWSLYGIGGEPVAMNLQDQVLYGVRSMVAAPTATVVAFATDCRDDCTQARPLLEALAMQALPELL
jgi:EpsI family protein